MLYQHKDEELRREKGSSCIHLSCCLIWGYQLPVRNWSSICSDWCGPWGLWLHLPIVLLWAVRCLRCTVLKWKPEQCWVTVTAVWYTFCLVCEWVWLLGAKVKGEISVWGESRMWTITWDIHAFLGLIGLYSNCCSLRTSYWKIHWWCWDLKRIFLTSTHWILVCLLPSGKDIIASLFGSFNYLFAKASAGNFATYNAYIQS